VTDKDKTAGAKAHSRMMARYGEMPDGYTCGLCVHYAPFARDYVCVRCSPKSAWGGLWPACGLFRDVREVGR
jgi:hypothetical protein